MKNILNVLEKKIRNGQKYDGCNFIWLLKKTLMSKFSDKPDHTGCIGF